LKEDYRKKKGKRLQKNVRLELEKMKERWRREKKEENWKKEREVFLKDRIVKEGEKEKIENREKIKNREIEKRDRKNLKKKYWENIEGSRYNGTKL